MRAASLRIVLLLGVSLLAPAALFPGLVAHGQNGDLPIDPDSIYRVISSRGEMVRQGHTVPERLSVAEWRADLDTLATRMHRRLPYPEAATGGASFHRRLDSLKQEIPNQSRDQRILSVMRLVNLPALGTGHTRLRSNQRPIGWRTLPVYPYRFADGVYIMSAADPDWIGSEILSVGGTPVDSVYAALGPYVSSDNQHKGRDVEETPIQFRWVDHLKALGILDQTDEVPMRIRTREGRVQRIRVESMRPDTPDYVRFLTSSDTRPNVPPDLQWSPGTAQQDNNEPNYRLAYRDSTDLLYLDLNLFVNTSEDYTMADLADSLKAIADRRPIDKVVVDLRTNGGGSNSLGEPLVQLLGSHPKIDERGTLYTLISPVARSAGGMFAMQMERRTKTIFAGEQSSFTPNIWGENAITMLPNSKITVKLSYHYKASGMPNEPRTHLEPDLRVPMTADQHFQNVDSTMMAVKRHEPAPRETVSLAAAERERLTDTYRMSPIHRAEITPAEHGLHLRVERGEEVPFIDTDLYPLSEGRLATDVTDVYVKRRSGEAGSPEAGFTEAGLTLSWKDTTYALEPVEGDFTLPLEHIRAGRLEEGAAGFRAAEAQGIKLGSSLTVSPLVDLTDERMMLAWPDSLSRKERARRALPYTRLATELAPVSWLAHFELAYVHKLLGNEEEMRKAAQKAVNLSPARGAQTVQQYLDLTVAQDRTVQ